MRRLALALSVLVVALGTVISVMGTAGARTGAAVGPIENFDRAAVAQSYHEHVVANFPVASAWNGSVSGCRAGTASGGFDGATVETINWFRRMSGLPPVVEDAKLSSRAQQAALMMEAAGSLSHHPGTDWPCYSASGSAGAGSSNLTLGIAGPRGVLGQIEDPGAGNEVLGHRRWLLYPRLEKVGVGNTNRASAVTVLADFGTRSTGADWVAWPPAGYVPAATVYDRWSLSFNRAQQADFSGASVTVTENGVPVRVRMLPVVAGYGDATLGWEPVGITPERSTDVEYRVRVTGIEIGGVSRTHEYTVTAFDSEKALAGSGEVAGLERRCLGAPATIVGTDGADVITGTPGPDVIVALGGDDQIDGGGGDDIICAGKGDDSIDGGDGADTVLGGQGNDVIRGGAGRDVLNGQNGRDRVAGNQGDDVLVGGNQRDMILGNTGHDSCWGSKLNVASTAPEEYRTCEAGRV